jgi:hypothetical protein
MYFGGVIAELFDGTPIFLFSNASSNNFIRFTAAKQP